MKELTDRQLAVVEYIMEYRRALGVSPSYREIAGHLGISHQAVQHIALGIRKKGLIRWVEGKARTLKVVI